MERKTHHEGTGSLEILGRRIASLHARLSHALEARAKGLDHPHLPKQAGKQPIARHGAHHGFQVFQRHSGSQQTWTPDLQTIGKDAHLHLARIGVVAMDHGIDQRFAHGSQRHCPDLLAPWRTVQHDLHGQMLLHEIHGIIQGHQERCLELLHVQEDSRGLAFEEPRLDSRLRVAGDRLVHAQVQGRGRLSFAPEGRVFNQCLDPWPLGQQMRDRKAPLDQGLVEMSRPMAQHHLAHCGG